MPAKETKQPLRIINLQAENIKRLTAVSITPTGNLVEITGKNGAGKTSVLDSIWWALEGAKHIQAEPIRKGQNKARIRLDLGELIVTRTFDRKDEGKITTSVVVESADGARFPSPQAIINEMLGAVTMDPFEFTRMKPGARFETLKGFVPGVDFAGIAAANLADYNKRTEVNARVKSLRAQAEAIAIPATVPERIDEMALVKEIAEVGQHNAAIDRVIEAAARAAINVTELEQVVDEIDEQIERLQRQRKETTDLLEERKVAAGAKPTQERKDAEALQQKLREAQASNLLVDNAAARAQLQEQADTAQKYADTLTEGMATRDKAKEEAIAKAKMPVPGLGFADEDITLDGVPFDQASDAERLRTSVAIAMAANPRLRVIRVREGSLLDEDGLKILAEMAAKTEPPYQVWIERVDSSGKVGFVIEDGHVAHAPEVPAKAEETAQQTLV